MKASVKWTVAIVALLAGNVIAMVTLAMIANTSNAQIIPDYYERAAHYDHALDEATRSVATGWTSEATLAATSITVTLRDAAGEPLDGARLEVTGYPRAHAARTLAVTLQPLGAGRYTAALPVPAYGRHDLKIVAELASQRFVEQVTIEAHP